MGYQVKSGSVVKIWHDHKGHDYTVLGYLVMRELEERTIVLLQKTSTINKDGSDHLGTSQNSFKFLPVLGSPEQGDFPYIRVSRVVSLGSLPESPMGPRQCSQEKAERLGFSWEVIDGTDLEYKGVKKAKQTSLEKY